jgi:hypothetical protein
MARFADAVNGVQRTPSPSSTRTYAAAISRSRYILAVVWMNLGNVQAAQGTDESCLLARDAARSCD